MLPEAEATSAFQASVVSVEAIENSASQPPAEVWERVVKLKSQDSVS